MLPIVKGILKGDWRSISRAISIIDNDEPDSRGIIQEIFNKTGGGRTIGFTGAGGAGKSHSYWKIGARIPKDGSQGCGSSRSTHGEPSQVGLSWETSVRMISSIDNGIYMRGVGFPRRGRWSF